MDEVDGVTSTTTSGTNFVVTWKNVTNVTNVTDTSFHGYLRGA